MTVEEAQQVVQGGVGPHPLRIGPQDRPHPGIRGSEQQVPESEYAGQLARCLKALGTDAPIRADVQRELAAVRAEQESRASTA